MPKIVGLGVAKEMILAGRIFTGAEAAQFGLAYKCVPQKDLQKTAEEVAQAVLAKGPLSISFAKACLNRAFSVDEESGLKLENQAFSILMASEDKKEGVGSFFEKRKPNFKNK